MCGSGAARSHGVECQLFRSTAKLLHAPRNASMHQRELRAHIVAKNPHYVAGLLCARGQRATHSAERGRQRRRAWGGRGQRGQAWGGRGRRGRDVLYSMGLACRPHDGGGPLAQGTRCTNAVARAPSPPCCFCTLPGHAPAPSWFAALALSPLLFVQLCCTMLLYTRDRARGTWEGSRRWRQGNGR
jgi:hypothetical protein